MKFGEVLKAARTDLVVTPKHEAWLAANPSAHYSDEALEFGAQELLKLRQPRDRRGTVSASSLGGCIRQQQFTFIGMPEGRWQTDHVGKVQNGNFVHLRWQMAGLTAGWLLAAEVPVDKDNRFNLRGTLDGIAYDGTIVEIKSINAHGYAAVQTFGPKEDHIFQVATYMAATESVTGSIIYENKNTQEYSEHIVNWNSELEQKVLDQAHDVWVPTMDKQLVEPLSKCIDREGWRYNYCPFKDRCLEIRSWAQAEERASEHVHH